MKKTILIVITIIWLLNTNTMAQPKPELMLETGMHISAIRSIATDAEGKYLLSCSDDKTARLWDAGNGMLLKTFRVPANNRTGKLFACSISPDAKQIALGGETDLEEKGSFAVYIFNTQTAAITQIIKDLPETINDLAFSANGKWLAISLWGDKDIEIYDVQTWELKKKLPGYKGRVYSMCFNAARNEFATAGVDGMLRLYDNDFNLIAQTDWDQGKEPISLSFDKTGSLLAVGYNHIADIEVHDAKTLAVLYHVPAINPEYSWGKMEKVCFSRTGNTLFTAGSLYNVGLNNNGYPVRAWDKNGKTGFTNKTLFSSPVQQMLSLTKNRTAVITTFPEIAMINDSGKIVWRSPGKKMDYDMDESHFKIDNTGNLVGLEYWQGPDLIFNVRKRSITSSSPGLLRSRMTNRNGTCITDYRQSIKEPSINGDELLYVIGRYELSICADVSSDGQKICIGTNKAIHLVNKNGEEVWKMPITEKIKAVIISGNDKLVVAAFIDGTMKWYRMKDGKVLLTLFLYADKKEWVLFTPAGYYDASPGAEDLLAFITDNGPGKEPGSYPATKFKKEYYRPDIIDKVLVEPQ